MIKFLCEQDDDASLLLVSHQPLVSELIASLCEVSQHTINMHTAALASIELNPVAFGMGKLQFVD